MRAGELPNIQAEMPSHLSRVTRGAKAPKNVAQKATKPPNVLADAPPPAKTDQVTPNKRTIEAATSGKLSALKPDEIKHVNDTCKACAMPRCCAVHIAHLLLPKKIPACAFTKCKNGKHPEHVNQHKSTFLAGLTKLAAKEDFAVRKEQRAASKAGHNGKRQRRKLPVQETG